VIRRRATTTGVVVREVGDDDARARAPFSRRRARGVSKARARRGPRPPQRTARRHRGHRVTRRRAHRPLTAEARRRVATIQCTSRSEIDQVH
jgi:hypothetical protein